MVQSRIAIKNHRKIQNSLNDLFQGLDDLLGGAEEEEEVEGGVAPASDLVHADGTLMLFPGSSCSRTGSVNFSKNKPKNKTF